MIQATDQASTILGTVGKNMDGLRNKAGQLASGGFEKITSAGKTMVTGLMVGIPILGGLIGGFGVKALQSAAQMETMGIALETAMGGNIEMAKEAQKNIIDFATKTPFALGEVQTAFVKLKNMGLDPSNRALTSYGDTASAMGKSLNDMVEAVADAATGEFERLKEFGIRSESNGNKVKLTFKGVTTEIGKNSKEIEGYLIKLGETNFGGGMEKQSKSLSGLWSTLVDTISLKSGELMTTIGGVSIVKNSFEALINALSSIDIGYYIDNFTNLFNVIFKGDFKGGIFGIGEDDDVVHKFFEIREGLQSIYDLVVNGDFTGKFAQLFNIGEDDDTIHKFFEIREGLQGIYDNVNKLEASRAILVGFASVILIAVLPALASVAATAVIAAAPFIALAAVIAFLYYAWQTNMGGIQELMATLWVFIEPILLELMAEIKQLGPELMNLYNVIQPYIIPVFTFLAQVIGGLIVGAIVLAINIFRGLVDMIKTGIRIIVESINNFRNIFEGMSKFITGIVKGDWGMAFEGLKQVALGVFDQIVTGIKGSMNLAMAPINVLIRTYNKLNDVFNGSDIPEIPKFALGTQYAPGGMSLVGENGPELVSLQRGSKVRTATATKDLMGQSGGNTINITIGSYLGTERDRRRLAEDLVDAIDAVRKPKPQ